MTACFGSWHTVRHEVVREIITTLKHVQRHPEIVWPDFKPELAQHNARVAWIGIGICLLMGVRPFEAVRIRVHHIDSQGRWLAIKGKSNIAHRAYRLLPLPTVLADSIEMLTNYSSLKPNSRLLLIYQQEGWRRKLQVADLNWILEQTALKAGLDHAPDAYSLRHLFRSELLSAGIARHYINYLMGHQGVGVEFYSPYLEHTPKYLEQIYLEFARNLAQRLGFDERTNS